MFAIARRSGVQLAVALAGKRAHLSDKLLLLGFGKMKIGLLQAQTAFAALFVVRLFRQIGAGCSLSSQDFRSCHSRPSDYSDAAVQHFYYRNATA
jgi:hypothetical protein